MEHSTLNEVKRNNKDKFKTLFPSYWVDKNVTHVTEWTRIILHYSACYKFTITFTCISLWIHVCHLLRFQQAVGIPLGIRYVLDRVLWLTLGSLGHEACFKIFSCNLTPFSFSSTSMQDIDAWTQLHVLAIHVASSISLLITGVAQW